MLMPELLQRDIFARFPQEVFAAELTLTLLAAVFGLYRPSAAAALSKRVSAPLQRLAKRPVLSLIAVAFATCTLRFALLPWIPAPVPAVHDETAYLLGGDTFASGRLTNPTHPYWQHFETFYVFFQPSYAPKYPPGQSVFLAVGWLLGNPWLGIVCSVSLMVAAVTWCLRGWTSPGWALFGGLLVMLRIGIFSYWMNSYWGGAAAALGGALVIGAVPRLSSAPRARDAVLLAAGVLLIANTRPFEALWMLLPVGVALAAGLRYRWRLRPLIPAAALLVAGGLATSYHAWRLTGNPLRLPYLHYDILYRFPSPFVWQSPPPPPEYRHTLFRLHYEEQQQNHLRAQSPAGWARRTTGKAIRYWAFFVGPLLTLPVLFGVRWREERRRLPLWACVAFTFLGASLATPGFPHYIAPATAPLYALVLGAIQGFAARSWRGIRPGVFFQRAIPVILLAVIALRIGYQRRYFPPDKPVPSPDLTTSWCCVPPGDLTRADLDRQLHGTPGSHLVFVSYSPKQPAHVDWVYNRADIDGSKVVWARRMSEESDLELARYYSTRSIWEVDPGEVRPRLRKYRPAGAAPGRQR
jgi:hypothetical protein